MASERAVLVAGATGKVGREVVAELRRRGRAVIAVGRDRRRLETLGDDGVVLRRADTLRPDELRGLCRGAGAVISCVGASPRADLTGRRSYGRVDVPANENLLAAAMADATGPFVYVSAHGADVLPGDYFGAHRLFEESLATSGFPHAIVRPTGFYSSFEPFVKAARFGLAPVIGDGTARSNPVHDGDVALACIDALERPSGSVIELGGPEVLTRREIVELAFRALGRRPRIVRLPPAFVRAASALVRPFVPRLGHLAAFIVTVMTRDLVAPTLGTRPLLDYFAGLARRAAAP